jgi:hypothetical protein
MDDRNYFLVVSAAIVEAESVAVVAAESVDIAAESTAIVAVESTAAASSVLGLLWQAATVIIVPTNSKAKNFFITL